MSEMTIVRTKYLGGMIAKITKRKMKNPFEMLMWYYNNLHLVPHVIRDIFDKDKNPDLCEPDPPPKPRPKVVRKPGANQNRRKKRRKKKHSAFSLSPKTKKETKKSKSSKTAGDELYQEEESYEEEELFPFRVVEVPRPESDLLIPSIPSLKPSSVYEPGLFHLPSSLWLYHSLSHPQRLMEYYEDLCACGCECPCGGYYESECFCPESINAKRHEEEEKEQIESGDEASDEDTAINDSGEKDKKEVEPLTSINISIEKLEKRPTRKAASHNTLQFQDWEDEEEEEEEEERRLKTDLSSPSTRLAATKREQKCSGLCGRWKKIYKEQLEEEYINVQQEKRRRMKVSSKKVPVKKVPVKKVPVKKGRKKWLSMKFDEEEKGPRRSKRLGHNDWEEEEEEEEGELNEGIGKEKKEEGEGEEEDYSYLSVEMFAKRKEAEELSLVRKYVPSVFNLSSFHLNDE
ncbi:hypothetical protein ADUPG1_010309, partial [Aduncisulcus paluster]